MKRILLAFCWLCLASYCALTAIAGPSGVIAMRGANDSAERMRGNLGTLKALHETYAGQWDALRTAPEAISLEARSLGYISDDEIAVRLPLTAGDPTPPSAGERIAYEANVTLTDVRIKELSAAVALASVAIMALVRLLKKLRAARNHRDIFVHVASRA